MHVLFDQGTPVPLRNFLPAHQVSTAFELGWHTLKNGELLQEAENAGFELLVTTDQHLKYQQILTERRIAVIVLTATSWPRIQKVLPNILEAISGIGPNGYIEVDVPYEK